MSEFYWIHTENIKNKKDLLFKWQCIKAKGFHHFNNLIGISQLACCDDQVSRHIRTNYPSGSMALKRARLCCRIWPGSPVMLKGWGSPHP